MSIDKTVKKGRGKADTSATDTCAPEGKVSDIEDIVKCVIRHEIDLFCADMVKLLEDMVNALEKTCSCTGEGRSFGTAGKRECLIAPNCRNSICEVRSTRLSQ